jgi:predicted aspartyl protease
MPTLTGYLDSNGHPILSVRVTGPNRSLSIDVEAMIEAMIDTGFSGFLMLPTDATRPLGLVARGASDSSLADGTVVTYPLAKATVTVLAPRGAVKAETVPPTQMPWEQVATTKGRVVLGGEEALLGVDFIRKLNRWLVVGKSVLLVDDEAIQSLLLTS